VGFLNSSDDYDTVILSSFVSPYEPVAETCAIVIWVIWYLGLLFPCVVHSH
jgi:hypothetical protein